MAEDLEASCQAVAFFSSKILTLQEEAIHQVVVVLQEEGGLPMVEARWVAYHSVLVHVSASSLVEEFPLEALVLQATGLEEVWIEV